MSAIWSQTLDQEIERVTRRLSNFLLQLFFNAPAIAILGYTGWLTVRGFLTGNYLTGGFFMHAFWVIAIILLFSFFVLQMCIRLIASARRISARALEKLKNQIDQVEGVMVNPVRTQLEVMLDLADRMESDAPKK
jgi:TRAP-type mannitol/chloroaromatic compound transport system permease small subunit